GSRLAKPSYPSPTRGEGQMRFPCSQFGAAAFGRWKRSFSDAAWTEAAFSPAPESGSAARRVRRPFVDAPAGVRPAAGLSGPDVRAAPPEDRLPQGRRP